MGSWRKYHAETRVFNGKRYDLERAFDKKRDAEARAKTLKKKGRLCRIVKWEASNLPAQYLVYSRFK